MVLTHASNVCGTRMPIEAVGKLCRERGIFFCVDAAQSAGLLPIDMDAMCIDALAFPAPVSYTHLDVYKRQGYRPALPPRWRR